MADGFPTRLDLFAVARQAVKATPGIKINPKMLDVPGSNVNLYANISALMGEAVVAHFVQRARGNFVATARGSQADTVIMDRYQLPRLPATSATVGLVISRPAAGAAGTVIAGTRVKTAAGTTFALDVDVPFGAADLSKPVNATAIETGSSGNVIAGAINAFVDQPFDTTLTVTNPDPAAGGNEIESLAEYKSRAMGFFATLRRGVLGAIEYGAMQVAGVAVATAFEIENPSGGLPAAAIELVIADRNGNASPGLCQKVADELLSWRCGGIPVVVSGGTVVYQAVEWDLAYYTGTNEPQAQRDVRAITVASAQYLRPGATLLRSTLIAAAQLVPGAIVADSSLALPAGDVVPTSNSQMIRIRPTDVIFV